MKSSLLSTKTALLLLVLLGFGLKLHSQKLTGYDKRLWKKNILLIEGIGTSQGVTLEYERIIQLGRGFSLRPTIGVTPFYLDHNYNWSFDKSISPFTGIGFYIFPNIIKLGVGCNVLFDVFYDRIPETIAPSDTSHGGSTEVYPAKQFKARVVPYIVVEGTVVQRLVLRAGFSPIIDPPNDAQKDVYFVPWATFAIGYRFGK